MSGLLSFLWNKAVCASSSTATATAAISVTIPQRLYWREVIRYTPNPKNPSLITFEDPTIMAMRSARAQSAEGLLRRQSKYIRYEKPWMERKRIKMVRKYKAMEKGVNDLKAYVKFVEDAKKVV